MPWPESATKGTQVRRIQVFRWTHGCKERADEEADKANGNGRGQNGRDAEEQRQRFLSHETQKDYGERSSETKMLTAKRQLGRRRQRHNTAESSFSRRNGELVRLGGVAI